MVDNATHECVPECKPDAHIASDTGTGNGNGTYVGPEECRIVVLRDVDMQENGDGETGIVATAAAYNLVTGDGRILNEGEANPDFDTFITEVRDGLDDIASNMLHDMSARALEGDDYATIYMNLMISLRQKPVEFVANMLATMLIGCLEDIVETEDVAETKNV